MFGGLNDLQRVTLFIPVVHSVGSAYATVYGGPQPRGRLEDMFEPAQQQKGKPGRSNSWTDATAEESSLSPNSTRSSLREAVDLTHGEARWDLLDEGEWGTYGAALAAYSDALYNWGLLEQRASVRKHAQCKREEVARTTISSSCPSCDTPLERSSCPKCR